MLFNPELASGPVPLDQNRNGEPARTRLGRARRVLVWALSIAALLIVALVGLLTFIVSFSVELPFVRNQVDATIEQALGPAYEATVSSAIIAVDPILGLVVRLSDISILDTLDQEVARIPSAMIALNLPAIITSQNLVRSVEIDGAWFSLTREGGVAFLGNAGTPASEAISAVVENAPNEAALNADAPVLVEIGPAGAGGGFSALSDPIEAIDKSLQEVLALADRGFDRIGIYNATIDLWRNGDPVPHRFERADLSFLAKPDEDRLSATMTASGYSGRWSMAAERIGNPFTGGRTLTLTFSQLTLADFFPAVGRGPSAVTTDIPFYGRAIVGIDVDGRVIGADAWLELGAGYFAFGPSGKPILLHEARVQLVWDVANDRINVEPSRILAGNGGATVVGEIYPDGVGRFAFDLESTDAVLAPSDSPEPPLAVDRMRIGGTLDLNAGLLNFDRAAIFLPRGSLVAAFSIGLERAGPSIALVATLVDMPVSSLKQLWPPGLEDGGRSWMLNAVNSGTVDGVLEAEIPAGILPNPEGITPEMLRMELNLRDISFSTFEGFPAVDNAFGRAVLAGTHFAVDLDDGVIVAPNEESLRLTAATFVVGQAGAAVPVGHLEVSATGTISAFGAVADVESISALQQFSVSPGSLSGTGAALMSAHWPLVEGMTVDEVEWRIGLTLAGLASDVPLDGMLIRDGDLQLDITPMMVAVTGVATIDDVTANVDLTFPMMPDIDGRQQLRMVLDEEARARLGFNLEGFLGGIVLATVTDLGPNAGQHYDLDLAQARVSLAPLGWAKPAGVPATMTFDVERLETGGQAIRNLQLTGDGFGFSAIVDLDANMTITRAEITDFSLRRADSMSFTFEQDGDGWAIEAVGEAFDARGMIADGVGGMTGTGGIPDLSIHGRFDELIGFNGERITDADVTFVSVGGVIKSINLSGILHGAPIVATFNTGSEGTILDVYVGNAGALMRFADIYNRGHDGEITIVGGALADGAVYGEVAMTNFDILDEPGLSRFMSPPVDDPNDIPTSVRFERLEFDFLQRGSVVTIADVLLRGGDMGAVGAGWIDLSAGSISISGTYIPAYTVNNIFGRIPIIGVALGGGPDEGLIGLTFQIAGPMDRLQLQVNPLSVIAPGIFRKIFQFQ